MHCEHVDQQDSPLEIRLEIESMAISASIPDANLACGDMQPIQ